MRGLTHILLLFRNEYERLNNTGASINIRLFLSYYMHFSLKFRF